MSKTIKREKKEVAKSLGREKHLDEQMVTWVGTIVEKSMTALQPALVASFRGKLAEISNRLIVQKPSSSEFSEGGVEWIGIDSLSKLRAQVGGRFQNLKERWLGAGFPLKEHRGEKTGSAEIDSVGWLELVTWLNKQGFEARVSDSDERYLFEIKEIK